MQEKMIDRCLTNLMLGNSLYIIHILYVSL
jgi:hypothetical protein